MLKKHSQFFESLLFISDLFIIAFSWLASYYFRFFAGVIPVDKGVPGLTKYSLLLVPIIVIWAFAFKGFGLYRPKRIGSRRAELYDISKACVVSVLVLIALTFFLRFDISRTLFVLFTAINILALSLGRLLFRALLRFLRRNGYNLRFALIVGSGRPVASLIERLEGHPEVGIKIEGMVSTTEGEAGNAANLKPLGHYRDIRETIRRRRIDNVFIALSWDEHSEVAEVLKAIGDEAVDIKVIPDIHEFMTLRGGVEEFDGMPILNLRNSPLYGWNMILKRSADILFASAALIFAFPVMLLIAALVKITSGGPVLYRQERMGIGGEVFRMIKFRSMVIDAERDTGAIWARQDDPRRTGFGAFLRGTSLDELPQLFNVLKGDMSVVGPRPERPVFIDEFRKSIPGYMLRHKMKAGITGWAQVNGWRGNTDLKKRIEHDIFYIENWSLAFDMKILWLTVWKGLRNRNAY
ncbi:MAG: undecaprenyl-phosphate glucose phosphotransferase [Deltaproteobacteria bacterium]|nr:undecaprenyl-phosphate glucose phosphotransferase [Deltaproteobacteria bacterium]